MAVQEIKPLAIEQSIDTSAVERDVQSWDEQKLVLANTGICREGGVTNLGAKLGLDSDYEETFYCSNGSKVQLKRDTINNCFHIVSDGREIGIVPLWAVKSRGLIPSNVADAMVTTDGTLLLLYYTQGLATVEEVNLTTFARIHIRYFAIPVAIAYITFVRTKAPTWANVTSIAGYSFVTTATTKTITGYIINDAGSTIFTGVVTCELNSSPISIHAYYEHGWILEIAVWGKCVLSNNLWMIKTDGSSIQISGITATKGLISDYKLSDTSITYKTFVEKTQSGPSINQIAGTTRNWYGVTTDFEDTKWACVFNGDIYKCPSGSTTFTAIGGTSRGWDGICADPSGNIYAIDLTTGFVYKCPYGSTTFTSLAGTSRAYRAICSDLMGNIWAVEGTGTSSIGDIYQCPVGSSTFTAIGGTIRAWTGICADSSNNIWATVGGGDIYKAKSGTTLFVAINGPSRIWRGICSDKNGNLYAIVHLGNIYECVSGDNIFNIVYLSNKDWTGISADINGKIWITVTGPNSIYNQTIDYTIYGYVFTPPASDGLAWAYSQLVDLNITASAYAQILTFGGLGLDHSNNIFSFFNFGPARDWTTNQKDVPELYGDIWPELTDFALKVHTIAGLASYISASFNVDGIGAPITEIGELSPYYCPQAVRIDVNNYLVLYQRGDNTFAVVAISRDSFDRTQEIASGVVKINTISGLNVADSINKDLKMGGNAFNGFAVVGFASLAQMGSYVARHRGLYGGSVDTGYKNNTAIVAGAVSLVVIPESIQYSPNNELIDIYVGLPPSSLNYFASIASGLAQILNNALLGTLYVDDAILPIPAGAVVSPRSALLVRTTALREVDYDGYQLGNEILGQYNSFVLYSSVYFVDSEWIRNVSISAGNVIVSAIKTVPVQGLRYLTASPQEAFFVADFDNALCSFNGGQSVQKGVLFNRREPIRDGVYSVIENTLALLEDSGIVFIRDGVITQTPLPFPSPPRVFATVDGIWLSQSGYSIRFVFNLAGLSVVPPIAVLDVIDGGVWGTAYPNTIDGGTWGAGLDVIDGGAWGSGGGSDMVVALLWQSKFLGVSDRAIQMIDRFLIRVYKEDKTAADITVTFEYFDENNQNIDARIFTVGSLANPYDSEGYAYIEYIPPQKRSVGASMRIECIDKILILSVIATLAGDGKTVAVNR
jgi:hypothetical protein